jgi:hypothetical protein
MPTTTTTSTTIAGYYYYDVYQYTCSGGTCSYVGGAITGRSSTPLTTGNTIYYKNIDGFIYSPTTLAAGPTYTVNLDNTTAQNSVCSTLCDSTTTTSTSTSTSSTTTTTMPITTTSSTSTSTSTTTAGTTTTTAPVLKYYTVRECGTGTDYYVSIYGTLATGGPAYKLMSSAFPPVTQYDGARCWAIISENGPEFGGSLVQSGTYYADCSGCLAATTTTSTSTSTSSTSTTTGGTTSTTTMYIPPSSTTSTTNAGTTTTTMYIPPSSPTSTTYDPGTTTTSSTTMYIPPSSTTSTTMFP